MPPPKRAIISHLWLKWKKKNPNLKSVSSLLKDSVMGRSG